MSNKDSVPHEIVHGNEGSDKLEHTQHEAPMPSQEKGGAIHLDPQTSASNTSTGPNKPTSSSTSNKDTSKEASNTTTSASSGPTHSSAEHSTGPDGKHTYAQMAAEHAHDDEKAKSSSTTTSSGGTKPSGGSETKPSSSSAGASTGSTGGSEKVKAGTTESHSSSKESGSGNKFDQVDRAQAEKFGGVNLSE